MIGKMPKQVMAEEPWLANEIYGNGQARTLEDLEREYRSERRSPNLGERQAGDDAISTLVAVRLERLQCADFIGLHQAAVMRDIGRHDGGQPPLDCWHGAMLYHASGFPPIPSFDTRQRADDGSSVLASTLTLSRTLAQWTPPVGRR
jgi:hypothetical protein